MVLSNNLVAMAASVPQSNPAFGREVWWRRTHEVLCEPGKQH